MQLIIPMTGLGTRFVNEGYTLPKPLIQVLKKPIIEHIYSMFDYAEKVIFIINEDHLVFGIDKILQHLVPHCIIVSEKNHVKKGPVYHTLLAKDHLDDTEVIVSYCDYFMQYDKRKFLEFDKKDACVFTYKGFHPHLLHNDKYGSLLEQNGRVVEYKEKHCYTTNPQDCHQSSGAYYFKKGSDLIKYSLQCMTKEAINGEWYTSQIIIEMMHDKHVTFFEVDKFCQWGTPRDLEEFEMNWLLVKRQTTKYWSEFNDNHTSG